MTDDPHTASDAPSDPRRPAHTPRFRSFLGVASTLALLYPLFICAAFYGEWIVAWLVLGHRPRPSLDDPKSVPISRYLHAVPSEMMQWWIHAIAVGVALAVADAFASRRSVSGTVLRLIAFGALWPAIFALARWDPGRVLYWWGD